jgi:hypothetical protein
MFTEPNTCTATSPNAQPTRPCCKSAQSSPEKVESVH